MFDNTIPKYSVQVIIFCAPNSYSLGAEYKIVFYD